MSYNIGALTKGTVQDLGHHSTSRSEGSSCSSNTLIEHSRSTTVKHLPLTYGTVGGRVGNHRLYPEAGRQ